MKLVSVLRAMLPGKSSQASKSRPDQQKINETLPNVKRMEESKESRMSSDGAVNLLVL